MKLLGLTIIAAVVSSYCDGLKSIFPKTNNVETVTAEFSCDTGVAYFDCSSIYVIDNEYYTVGNGKIDLLEPSLHYKFEQFLEKKNTICQKWGMLWTKW